MKMDERFRGMILGTAVGDSVGLPAEGISRRRVAKMFAGPWRQRLVGRWGMISDDTEHTIFVVQSLLAHSDDERLFSRRMGRCLKWWLALLPAGIGLGTARAIFKLWVGFPPSKSGVFTAGNGPAMRVAPVGAFFENEPEKLMTFTRLNTRITHTDPKAEIGSRAIAGIAAWIVREDLSQQPGADEFIAVLRGVDKDKEWQNLVFRIEQACVGQLSVDDFASELGLEKGITGYIYHTVPMVLYAWFKHFGSYEDTLDSIWGCGGDTDTTGAIAGALAGLTVGEQGIPSAWIDGLKDWPRSVSKMHEMADALAAKHDGDKRAEPVSYFWPGIILRNIFFLLIVLLHGFRRLLPPY